MEFYEVLEKRRTYRDFSDREVSDELLKRVIGAAFKAPTNDHLRQLEFIVVRGRENIARIITPLAKNMAAFKDLVFEADDSGDKDKRAMFADALPKQQKMLLDSGLLILPFFRQKQSPLLEPAEQSSLNYFASAWAAVENILLAATAGGNHAARRSRRRIGNGLPYTRERRGRNDKENRRRSRRLRIYLSAYNRLPR